MFRLDLDDGIDLLDIAAAVRIHDISPADLQAYLDGLNVSAGVYRLATHLSRQDMTSRELASQLERVVKGSGRSGGFCRA